MVFFFLLLVVHLDELVAVHAVGGKNNQHDEVRDEQAEVECVCLIKPFKSGIENVGADPMLGSVGL